MESKKQIILKKMLAELEIPESAYEKAVSRYKDIGDWFGRNESSLNQFDPHVFPQGSFRLGTVIKPINGNEEYDLDLSCKLRKGITKSSHTQEQVKKLVGEELKVYRSARNIHEKLEEKHRCWRLNYQDVLNFHADIVPAIPEDQQRRFQLSEAIRKSETNPFESAAETTVAITDDRDPNFRNISSNWKISNPEGYALWVEGRMRNQSRMTLLEKAQVDEVPTYKKKTPLQQSIQLLKRHRDSMFKNNPDAKPISVIITTLAARAYNGETDLATALTNILDKMGTFVRSSAPRVPNPTDPAEDFADRWGMEKYKTLNLEKNFWGWLQQAKADFSFLETSSDARQIVAKAKDRFAVSLNESELIKSLGLTPSSPQASAPKVQVISDSSAKPWGYKS